MTQDMVYATGAHPDYNPQMAESIVVRRYELELSYRTAYGIYWTTTAGEKKGRIFEYETESLEKLTQTDGDFPAACASTQAGCVWVWNRPDGTDYAELQTTARGIPITIQPGDWGPEGNPHLTWIRIDEVATDPVVYTGYTGANS